LKTYTLEELNKRNEELSKIPCPFCGTGFTLNFNVTEEKCPECSEKYYWTEDFYTNEEGIRTRIPRLHWVSFEES
jgi:endogenous inhibitor of DNA gyrase (YacG/DUF329 family)